MDEPRRSAGADAFPSRINYAMATPYKPCFDVTSQENTTVRLELRDITVRHARAREVMPSLDREGFATCQIDGRIVTDPMLLSANARHQMVPPEICRIYQLEVAEAVRAFTGADHVIPQFNGLMMRKSSRATGPGWAGPVHVAHFNYADSSAALFRDLSLRAARREELRDLDFVVLHTWHVAVLPPQDSLLALCDADTVSDLDSVLIDSVLGPRDAVGASFESRLSLSKAGHGWWVYPNLSPAELLVFVGYDSRKRRQLAGLHTAVDAPGDPATLVPRISFESRMFAFFERKLGARSGNG